jgi:hypothetical protein
MRHTGNPLKNFDPNSPYERREMIDALDGRVIEAMTESKQWRNLLRCVHRMTPEQKQCTRENLLWKLHDPTLRTDAINEERVVFLPIRARDWVCPAGHERELLGKEGSRRLRCPICEGYKGNFLTEFDHQFLREAGVRIQAE